LQGSNIISIIDKEALREGVGKQSHYMDCAIQPIEYIIANDMNFLEGNVIKYIARHRRKNGAEDLKKAQQYLDWLMENPRGKARLTYVIDPAEFTRANNLDFLEAMVIGDVTVGIELESASRTLQLLIQEYE